MSHDKAANGLEALKGYRPSEIDDAEWQVIRPALFDLVGPVVDADTPIRQARRYAIAATAFLRWLYQGGHPLSHPAELFSVYLVDGFLAQHLCDRPEHTTSTYRTTLRDIGRGVNPDAWSQTAERKVLSAPRPPYTEDEVRRLIIAARSVPRAPMRARTQAVLYAGLGAGVDTKDLRTIRPDDIRCGDDGAIEVHVGPPRRRIVPVLDRYADQLYAAAQQVTTAFVVGANPEYRNLVDRVDRNLRRFDAPRLGMSRLRATWIVEQLQRGVPYYDLLNAAGLRQHHWLSRYAVYVRAGQPHARDLLRGL